MQTMHASCYRHAQAPRVTSVPHEPPVRLADLQQQSLQRALGCVMARLLTLLLSVRLPHSTQATITVPKDAYSMDFVFT